LWINLIVFQYLDECRIYYKKRKKEPIIHHHHHAKIKSSYFLNFGKIKKYIYIL
jgi:hypothetical protein